jgi:hypothetical protein
MKWFRELMKKIPHQHHWKYDLQGDRRECSVCNKEEWLLLFAKGKYYYKWTEIRFKQE